MGRPGSRGFVHLACTLVLTAASAVLVSPAGSVSDAPMRQGYWLVGTDGSVHAFGDATFLGSMADRRSQTVAAVTSTPSGQGYWLVGADGRLFNFGDAGFFGSTGNVRLNKPIVGMAATPTAAGYWFVAADGGVFAFGDAGFYGSTGDIRLNKPIVDMAPTPTGRGYWLVAADGGIFSFGDAGFYGSTGDIRLNKPIVGMAPTPTGRGYWFVAADGGIFSFGDATFRGSTGGQALSSPIVAMTGLPAAPSRSPETPASSSTPEARETHVPSPTTGTTVVTPPGLPSPAPPPAAPFEVGLIGDTGYSESQEAALLKIRQHMNTAALAFVVHDGDIWNEGTLCSNDRYLEMLEMFSGFAHPFVYTPGDNEWTDCSSSPSGRLSFIRTTFFPTDETLGQRRMIVKRQEPPFVENARWAMGGVVFATLDEPGPSGRGGSHREANVAWLNAAFDEAEATGAPGVMIIWQDNPFEPSGGRLARTLKERTVAFGRPVVLVHGDTHRHRIDHPWGDVDNFTRVETHGDTSSPSWVRAMIDPSSPAVFSFDNEKAGGG